DPEASRGQRQPAADGPGRLPAARRRRRAGVSYIPNAQGERGRMLEDLGLTRVEDLFRQIPEELLVKEVGLPEPLSEVELGAYFRMLGRLNQRVTASNSFIGA